jgi:hypothetical protein
MKKFIRRINPMIPLEIRKTICQWNAIRGRIATSDHFYDILRIEGHYEPEIDELISLRKGLKLMNNCY